MKQRTAYGGILIFIALSLTIGINLRTPEIKAVHLEGHAARILLKNPPFTAREALAWWQENQTRLKSHYDIPQEDSDGVFYISVWDFADGYKEEGRKDRLCFEDMPGPRNCIDKNWVMTISRARNTKQIYVEAGDSTWVQDATGEFIRMADDN